MSESSNRRCEGFSLIELMIVVAILAIMAAFAYPSYRGYVLESRRTDGQAALLNAAQRLERCYASSMDYNGGACTAVGNDINGSESPEGFYQVVINTRTATTYQLVAAPRGSQADDKCGSLVVDQTGDTDIAGADSGVTAADCW